MKRPSNKQIIIIIILIVIVMVGSGFLTKRFDNPKQVPIDKKEVKELNIKRLFKADNHLQTITQPNEIKKQIAAEENNNA